MFLCPLSIRLLWKITCLSSHLIEQVKHIVRHIIIWQPFGRHLEYIRSQKVKRMILKDSFTLIIHCWCFIIFSVKNYWNMLEICIISIKFAPKWPLTSKCDMLWEYIYVWFALLIFRCTLLAVLSKNLHQQLLRGDEFNSYIFILHSFDLWSNSETQTHFQTWHPLVRLLAYIKEHN